MARYLIVSAGMEDNMITDLFRHNTWANLRLLEACEGLSDEYLDANLDGTFGSIRDTLLHIVGAEVSYVRRVNGRMPGTPPDPGTQPSIETLKSDAQWCGDELLQLALKATSADIVEQVRQGQKMRYKLTSLLTQAINHSTEHRAQIATILTQQGITPPDMSGWEYMDSTGGIELVSEEAALPDAKLQAAGSEPAVKNGTADPDREIPENATQGGYGPISES